MENIDDEYILCAAIWYQVPGRFQHQPINIDNGIVICGHRHHNILIFVHDFLPNISVGKVHNIQGFLTSKNKFVSRIEAGKIALKFNQIDKLSYGQNQLFSEDLY